MLVGEAFADDHFAKILPWLDRVRGVPPALGELDGLARDLEVLAAELLARGTQGELPGGTAAVLAAAGVTPLPLLPHRVHGAWNLAAVDHKGQLVLVAVLRGARPEQTGARYGLPGGWSPPVRRLLHVWRGEDPLHDALTL